MYSAYRAANNSSPDPLKLTRDQGTQTEGPKKLRSCYFKQEVEAVIDQKTQGIRMRVMFQVK